MHAARECLSSAFNPPEVSKCTPPTCSFHLTWILRRFLRLVNTMGDPSYKRPGSLEPQCSLKGSPKLLKR